MVWNNNQQGDGKFSEYNTAGLKMIRLDKIQTLINQINGNLLAFNEEFGVYNFELKFSQCNILYLEVESKLAPDEKKKAVKLKEAIEKALEEYNIFEIKTNNIYPYQKVKTVNGGVWKVIRKWLFKYEVLVRSLLDEHGMDTKYEDESALF